MTDPTATIAIPTFRRPERLRKLLAAVLGQRDDLPGAASVDVLVIDNCPDATARATVDGFEGRVRYIHESRAGVANARNRAVAEAAGDYLIFIDDDETPRDGWLAAFLAQASNGVDACFGPVEPKFEETPSPDLHDALDRMFSRRLHATGGQDISASRAWLGTGNSMFRRAACFTSTAPFDTRFNDGGEDVWFLRGLTEDKGVRLTWCPDAIVDEIVPASRMTMAYMQARTFNNGRLRCIVERGSGGPQAIAKTAMWMVIGAAQVGIYGLASLVFSVIDPVRGAGFRLRMSGGLGKLLWWRNGAAAPADKPGRVGYLMNMYPATSSTFIRREIAAHEAAGLAVRRYAVRRWNDALVDPLDRAEQEKTTYLLSDQTTRLVMGFFSEMLTNPFGLVSALATWLRLLGNAGGGFVRHVAYLLEAISLRRKAQSDGVGHIHAHFSTNTAAVALLCDRLGGPSYSFTAHGPDEFIDWGPKSLAMKVAGARFVAAISNYARVQLTLAAGMEHWDKIHIVHCGLDLDEFPVSDAGFDADAPFVCVGRLCPQKAQTLIVEATAQVAKTHPGIRVRLIGDGESRKAVEAAIDRHGLHESVELLGWRDNAEVRAELGQARALLLPSFAEGLPVVIMEAFALGRPAISTFIAGIPELVDDQCGWIIPAGSVDGIARAMKAALEASTETLAALGAEGRRRVERQHDVTQEAARLRYLFEGKSE